MILQWLLVVRDNIFEKFGSQQFNFECKHDLRQSYAICRAIRFVNEFDVKSFSRILSEHLFAIKGSYITFCWFVIFEKKNVSSELSTQGHWLILTVFFFVIINVLQLTDNLFVQDCRNFITRELYAKKKHETKRKRQLGQWALTFLD